MTAAALLDTVQGLPVHALIVHATVIVVPVVLIAVAVVAAVPRLRASYSWYAAGAAVALVALVGITILSGRELRDRLLPSSPEITAQIERHESLGNTLFWWSVAVAAAAVVLALLPRPGGRRKQATLSNIATVCVVILVAVASVQLIRAGHAGSEAVWKSTVESTNP